MLQRNMYIVLYLIGINRKNMVFDMQFVEEQRNFKIEMIASKYYNKIKGSKGG